MHQALHLLYGHLCCSAIQGAGEPLGTPLQLVEGPGLPAGQAGVRFNLSFIEDVKKAFAAAAKYIYGLKKFESGNMADEPVKALINATYTVLKKAVTSQVDYRISDAFLKKLQTDVFVFSGMKTYAQLRETASLLVADDGKGIRPYQSFVQEVKKVDAAYNERYLRTEYQYAATTGQNAARWQKYEAQKERYDLRYLTDNGPNVRESHRALEGTVLPVDDAFWNQYLPKNGWNCHCFVIQVRKGEYQLSNSDEAIKAGDKATTQLTRDGKNAGAMFRYNPGKQAVIFPPKHPYTLTRCGNKLTAADDDKCQAKKVVEGMAKENVKDETWKELASFENGGYSRIHKDVNTNDDDYKRVAAASKGFAKLGRGSNILPKFKDNTTPAYKEVFGDLANTPYKGKCPDLKVDDLYYEHEGYDRTGTPENWLRNMLTRGVKQSSRLVIEQPNDTDWYIKKTIRRRILQGQKIDEVWILDGEELRQVY